MCRPRTAASRVRQRAQARARPSSPPRRRRRLLGGPAARARTASMALLWAAAAAAAVVAGPRRSPLQGSSSRRAPGRSCTACRRAPSRCVCVCVPCACLPWMRVYAFGHAPFRYSRRACSISTSCASARSRLSRQWCSPSRVRARRRTRLSRLPGIIPCRRRRRPGNHYQKFYWGEAEVMIPVFQVPRTRSRARVRACVPAD
jgi:hypothetical protein